MTSREHPPPSALLDQPSAAESNYLSRALHDETVGGVLLLVAAAVALMLANSPWSGGYDAIRHFSVGPSSLGLHLDLTHWAADGLLAIFFFVAGLELKRELVVGQLRQPATAVLPVAAALMGMALPAGVFLAISVGSPGVAQGWAVPMATDIAVALAVLAVAGPSLPAALRAFLLTLAVVDDLGAIVVIALVYTDQIDAAALAVAVVGTAAYAWLQRRRVRAWWVYLPLALTVWGFVHASGVHATVAGVALGLATRVRPDRGEPVSPAERLEHRLRPISAGFALPVFAFMSAGVSLSPEELGNAVSERAAIAVAAGLLLGKFVGIAGGTFLVARFTRATLAPDVSWGDIRGIAMLSGIGFTVSLLLADLAYAGSPERTAAAKTAVLGASALAALIGVALLRSRNRHHRRHNHRGPASAHPGGNDVHDSPDPADPSTGPPVESPAPKSELTQNQKGERPPWRSGGTVER